MGTCTSWCRMTFQMKRYVERFGDYYGVTVYRLYPDQPTQEEYLGTGSTSYRRRLAELLRREISWLSYQSRTLTSRELLSSPRIRYRDTRHKKSVTTERNKNYIKFSRLSMYFTATISISSSFLSYFILGSLEALIFL